MVSTAQKFSNSARAVAQRVAHGILHEAVGHDDPHGGQVARRGHGPDGETVQFFTDFVPAEGPHGHKGGFEKEGYRGFNGQQRAENIAHIGRVAGPVGTELEFQGDARDHPQHEVDEEQLAPKPGHAFVGFIPGADVQSFHDRQKNGDPQRQRHENEVEEDSHRKLQA